MADTQPIRIPLIEPLETRDATTLFDAKAVNCVTEKTPRGELMARKRPGLAFASQGKAGTGQGLANYQSNLYSISGDFLNVLSGATPSLTALLSTNATAFSPRVGPAVVGFNGYMYVMGGTNSGGTTLNDVWKSADGVNWIQVTANAPWGARAKAQAIVFNNTMYIMGGAVSNTGTHYGDVWSTTDGINWTQTNTSAWPARRRFGATVFNNRMWVAGGAGADTTVNPGYPSTKYSDVWYTADGANWTQSVAQAPWVPRSDLALYSVGATLYLLGGLFIDAFAKATSDLWKSTDGITWTLVNSNPFGVVASGVWPIAALNSSGQDFAIPSGVTVGSGAATAFAFTDFDGDGDDDDLDAGPYVEVTFSTVGSYTAAPTVSLSSPNIGFNAGFYALLDGTATGGSKALRVAASNNIVYVLELQATGTYNHVLWQSTDGVTFTNTGASFAAGWTPRDGEFFSYGNLWFTSGFDNTNYYHDVWYISIGGSNFALSPNVPLGFYHFNQTPSTITSPLLVFKSTKDLYTYNAALQSLTKLSNAANYPTTTVPGLVVLDAQFFVMDPQGRIWGSAINDPTTWTALNVIAMQNEPTGGVAIAKLATYVVAYGQWTTEFFYDAGGPPPGSPLLPQTSLPFDVGCANGESVREMQGNIIWVGQTKIEGQGVYMFQNYTPVRISTAFVDRILQSDPLQNITAINVDASGHSLYILTLKNSNITLVYSFNTKLWDVWTTTSARASVTIQSLTSDSYGLVTAAATGHGLSDGDPVVISGASNNFYNGLWNAMVVNPNTFTYLIPAATAANMGTAVLTGFTENAFSPVASAQVLNIDYLQDPTNGVIYSQNFTTYGDAPGASGTVPIGVRIVTNRFDAETSEWKHCRRISLLGDIVSSNAMLAYTDNDYQSYSSFRTMPLNQGQRATLAPAGRFRRRAFQIRHTAYTPFRAMALELEIIKGGF